MSGHFLHLWTLCQKNAPQIFERRSSCKDIGQNIKDSCFWVSSIAPILKTNTLTLIALIEPCPHFTFGTCKEAPLICPVWTKLPFFTNIQYCTSKLAMFWQFTYLPYFIKLSNLAYIHRNWIFTTNCIYKTTNLWRHSKLAFETCYRYTSKTSFPLDPGCC